MKADSWGTVIGSSDCDMRQVQFCTLSNPVVPFRDGVVSVDIPNLSMNLIWEGHT